MSLNSFAPIDPNLIDVVLPEHDGYPDELAAEDTADALRDACGAASREFPESLWIEPRHWAEKARENDANDTWAMNYIDRFTNQNPTHECTCHSLRANFEAARNRQLGIIFPDGPMKDQRYDESKRGSVWVSPLSVYAEANPRIRGGANVRQVLEIACRRGMLPEKIQPYEYGFKHTIVGTQGKGGKNQSSGPWVKLKDFPDGWEETAACLMPLEVIFTRMWEQNICLMLNGLADSCGRDGHAVPRTQLIFKGDNLNAAAYPDSYDIVRYDSLATIKRSWQGCFTIATVTAPDDWQRPGG
jgi:hypothetical protein